MYLGRTIAALTLTGTLLACGTPQPNDDTEPDRIETPSPEQLPAAVDLAKQVKRHALNRLHGDVYREDDLIEYTVEGEMEDGTHRLIRFYDHEPIGNYGKEDKIHIHDRGKTNFDACFADVGLDGFQQELLWSEYAILRPDITGFSHDFRDKTYKDLDVPQVNQAYGNITAEAKYTIKWGTWQNHQAPE